MKVGVLALQGDVPEHLRTVGGLLPERSVIAVRQPEQLGELNALFLPGGESTTIARLMVDARLWEPVRERLADGLPVLGTCAGLILLARDLEPSPGGLDPPTLGVLDARVRRNDYGAQRESFEAPVRMPELRGPPFPGVFIRAPRILGVGAGAKAIAWQGKDVVGVRAGSVWGLTFHPELADDLRVHRRFLVAAGLRV